MSLQVELAKLVWREVQMWLRHICGLVAILLGTALLVLHGLELFAVGLKPQE